MTTAGAVNGRTDSRTRLIWDVVVVVGRSGGRALKGRGVVHLRCLERNVSGRPQKDHILAF